jgi:LacI family transcriptional regulator
MIAGVSDRLAPAGFDVMLAAAREKTELRTYERLVRSRRVDGLIVAHTRVVDERVDYLLRAGFPFVGYGRTGNPDGFAWLDFDNEAGCLEAVRQLTAIGHRRIAYVHAPLELNFAHQRQVGFLRGMAEAKLRVRSEYLLHGSLDRRGGYAAGLQLMALATRPTAVLVDNNLGGVGVLRALLEAGVAIGRDVSVVINDGIPPDTLLFGQDVAAVTQPTAYESGTTMAEMLLRLIEGKPLERRQVLLQPKFVSGASLGPPPV